MHVASLDVEICKVSSQPSTFTFFLFINVVASRLLLLQPWITYYVKLKSSFWADDCKLQPLLRGMIELVFNWTCCAYLAAVPFHQVQVEGESCQRIPSQTCPEHRCEEKWTSSLVHRADDSFGKASNTCQINSSCQNSLKFATKLPPDLHRPFHPIQGPSDSTVNNVSHGEHDLKPTVPFPYLHLFGNTVLDFFPTGGHPSSSTVNLQLMWWQNGFIDHFHFLGQQGPFLSELNSKYHIVFTYSWRVKKPNKCVKVSGNLNGLSCWLALGGLKSHSFDIRLDSQIYLAI